MKHSDLVLTEERRSPEEASAKIIIQQAVNIWLTKELSQYPLC